MDSSRQHASGEQTQINQEEQEVELQIKRETLEAERPTLPARAEPLKLVSARKRKKPTESTEPNELFVDSSASREADRRQGNVRTPGVQKSRRVVNSRPAKEPSERDQLYVNLDTNPKQKAARPDIATLEYAITLTKNCIEAINSGKDEDLVDEHFTKLRRRIHEMEFYEFLNGAVIKQSKVLESKGLKRIFDSTEKDKFPWDIRADAEALWNRWILGDIDGHLLRGIVTTKGVLAGGAKRTAYKLEPAYEDKKFPNVAGSNSLINGQWWPSRLAARRDGAHGEIEAGISGQTGKGAYAVVISTGYKDDRDNGDAVEYCGTQSPDENPTKGTSLLLEAFKLEQPVRVLRSSTKKSKYAPVEGIRYDGLYAIRDKEILNPKKLLMRFSLRRLPGQDPIRYKGVEKRPTDQELFQRSQIRHLLDLSS